MTDYESLYRQARADREQLVRSVLSIAAERDAIKTAVRNVCKMSARGVYDNGPVQVVPVEHVLRALDAGSWWRNHG